MFMIIHLELVKESMFPLFDTNPTDYGPMDLEQAESIVTELNRDAIQSSLPDRWIIMSQDK